MAIGLALVIAFSRIFDFDMMWGIIGGIVAGTFLDQFTDDEE